MDPEHLLHHREMEFLAAPPVRQRGARLPIFPSRSRIPQRLAAQIDSLFPGAECLGAHHQPQKIELELVTPSRGV
jgi:hypothetical protein